MVHVRAPHPPPVLPSRPHVIPLFSSSKRYSKVCYHECCFDYYYLLSKSSIASSQLVRILVITKSCRCQLYNQVGVDYIVSNGIHRQLNNHHHSTSNKNDAAIPTRWGCLLHLTISILQCPWNMHPLWQRLRMRKNLCLVTVKEW